MLKSKNRLKLSSDFDKLYRDGVRFRGEYGMLICFVEESSNSPMFGFVVNKKIGNAVQRHYFQRRARHVVRDFLDGQEPDTLSGLKCSYIAYKNFENYGQLQTDLLKLLKSAKVYHSKNKR